MSDLNHLHLHVRDVERSQRFYASWFGFRAHARYDDIQFVRNADDFDLALAPDADPEAFPPWFHFGFRLSSRDDVRTLYERMAAEGVPMREPLSEEGDLIWFRCLDPDGYLLEVYWE